MTEDTQDLFKKGKVDASAGIVDKERYKSDQVYKNGVAAGKEFNAFKREQLHRITNPIYAQDTTDKRYAELVEGKPPSWLDGFNAGYNSGSCCFITTACIQAKNLPDDCSELTTMRSFRDRYVRKLPNGLKLIQQYCEIAPTIIKKINMRRDSKKIYSYLYKVLVLRTTKLIKFGKNKEALQNCIDIITKLKEKYLEK